MLIKSQEGYTNSATQSPPPCQFPQWRTLRYIIPCAGPRILWSITVDQLVDTNWASALLIFSLSKCMNLHSFHHNPWTAFWQHPPVHRGSQSWECGLSLWPLSPGDLFLVSIPHQCGFWYVDVLNTLWSPTWRNAASWRHMKVVKSLGCARISQLLLDVYAEAFMLCESHSEVWAEHEALFTVLGWLERNWTEPLGTDMEIQIHRFGAVLVEPHVKTIILHSMLLKLQSQD